MGDHEDPSGRDGADTGRGQGRVRQSCRECEGRLPRFETTEGGNHHDGATGGRTSDKRLELPPKQRRSNKASSSIAEALCFSQAFQETTGNVLRPSKGISSI